MDDSSPSMRTITGTPFFVKVVDNPPSFSIGLTQDFGFNAGSVAKAKQVQVEKFIEELRSKKKNDPIEIRKVINIAKASDTKIVEGESMRKIVNSDSEDIKSASSDLDKPKDHQKHQVLA
ncbi:hypothetical protein KY289_017322 [Solanum tuberosum]|nr:hypothetical protein KY289_017322 [Solanum tuberosum]